MNDHQPIIVRDPEILSGVPVFRGTRVQFKTSSIIWKEGIASINFLEQFPSVKREHAIAALEQAKESLIVNLR